MLLIGLSTMRNSSNSISAALSPFLNSTQNIITWTCYSACLTVSFILIVRIAASILYYHFNIGVPPLVSPHSCPPIRSSNLLITSPTRGPHRGVQRNPRIGNTGFDYPDGYGTNEGNPGRYTGELGPLGRVGESGGRGGDGGDSTVPDEYESIL